MIATQTHHITLHKPQHYQSNIAQALQELPLTPAHSTSTIAAIPVVPFYSQFNDISSVVWQKKGCGIASLAMIIKYYKPKTPITVNGLLKEGIAAGAFIENVGWTYKGLISVSNKYGFQGTTYDFGKANTDIAYSALKEHLKNGPVMASVHYKLDPASKIPHLIVVDGIKDNMVYYSDPAEKNGQKAVPVATFRKAWKKRYIVIRPTSAPKVAMAL